jgi:hypothetical protein
MLFGADAPTVVEGCLVHMEATSTCNFCHAWILLLLKWQVLNLNPAIVWSGARLGGLSVHRFHILNVQHVTWFSPHLSTIVRFIYVNVLINLILSVLPCTEGTTLY